MTTTHTASATMSADEARIRELTDDWAAALRARDLDGVMAGYTPDVEVFGITPPLHYRGARAHREHWERMFASFEGPVGYAVRDLKITTSGDAGFAHCLNRISGTMKDGKTGGTWVRVTVCYRKIDGEWKVSHEHVSVPFDSASGRAVLDLMP